MATTQFATIAGGIILFSIVVSGVFALISKAKDLKTRPKASDPVPPIEDESHESFPKDPIVF